MLDTLEYLVHETDVWVEITTLLIPGKNDSDAELDAMTGWVVDRLGPDVPMHFTAFHPDFNMTDRPAHASGDAGAGAGDRAAQRRAPRLHGQRPRRRGRLHLLRCVRARLIERDWYRIGEYRVTDDGRCGVCDAPVPGRFAGPAGTWGARRQPVRMRDRMAQR